MRCPASHAAHKNPHTVQPATVTPGQGTPTSHQPVQNPLMSDLEPEVYRPHWRRILNNMLTLLVLSALGYGGWWIWQHRPPPAEAKPMGGKGDPGGNRPVPVVLGVVEVPFAVTAVPLDEPTD